MRKTIIFLMLLVVILPMSGQAYRPRHGVLLSDTILNRQQSDEVGTMGTRMVQSAYPVHITTVGSAVCVKSNYNQILPVYTASGAFYAAFRLNKGTNWLSGLPRGTYYINNRKITIA